MVHNFQGCNSITHYICKFVCSNFGFSFECALYIYYTRSMQSMFGVSAARYVECSVLHSTW